MKFIRNLSIRNKLLLISLIPVAALLYFLSSDMWDKITRRNNIRSVYNDVLEVEKIGDIGHTLQLERSYSINYLASGVRDDKNEMLNQRVQTDKAIAELQLLVKEQKRHRNLAFTDSLPRIREAVNVLTRNIDSVAIAYSDINLRLIHEVNETYRGARDPEIRNLLESHLLLLYGKFYLSLLRMRIHLAILNNSFRPNDFAEFASLKGKYENNLERFNKNVSGELLTAFNKKMNDPTIKSSKAFIDSVFHNPAYITNLSTDVWKSNINAYLNGLKELEDMSSFYTRQLTDQKQASLSGSLIKSIVIVGLVILIISWLLYYIVLSIADSIRIIKMAADRIAQGEVDLTVPVTSKDEIGELATSFNQFIQVTKEYAGIADSIAKGDYSPEIRIRGDRDLLSKALMNMKNNLLQLSRESETRTWLLTGAGELNDKMRGEKDIQELAQGVISQLTTYLNAQLGAIYLAQNGHLNLAGSYAFHERKGNINQIQKGHGLVGQAALEKKPIVFSNIPEDYVKITSGLGHVSPKHILVYPFLFDNSVKGVVEIGTVHEVSDLQMQLLNVVADNMGIAFNSSESRMKLKELLEQTQRQSEELAAQQEELKQTNEELQEKTELLERSEAELKAQQEELQQTNEELEEKAGLLEEQKEKLEVTKMEVENKARELEATSKYKSEFLANMSHELRTPLNSILILAQLLAENKNGSLSPKDIEFARNIYNSGNDLLSLINEILDLSKVEAGKIEIEIDEVPLDPVVESLRQLFNEMAKSKNIEFNIRHNKEHFHAPLFTDKQRLEQILRNLLSNAFKFTDKLGSVDLSIDVQPPDKSIVNPALQQLNEVVVFAVSDTGIGIPESKQGVVFEAFQQADGSTKRKYGGTGLGLSISRQLAGALGGELHLQSEEGKGSTFTLYLPLQFDAAIAASSGKAIEVRKPVVQQVARERKIETPVVLEQKEAHDDRYTIQDNDKVILIIEDDVTFANVLLTIAREKNYKGIIAHQGNTGLSLARYYRPDAIMLDMKLPVLDGSEVLRLLKNDPELRHIPVQIISGYDRRKEGLELGAFDFIKKPLTREGVHQAFDRIQDFINRKLKKLLVVEDNQQQNQAIRELVGNGDVKSFAAYSGEEAYAMLQEQKFDCIIIDLGLPDMSGLQLMEKMKENEELSKIPIIVYTGRDMNKEEARQLEKLANTVVLKTSDSKERLLDETALFLHRIESGLPKEKQQIIRKLHRTEEVLKHKKVLIVDDDMRNTYSLTNVLEDEGMKCYIAENGRVAMETLQKHKDIDIVLMDIMMPEMDGYEATQEIRQMSEFNKLPIIALTAKAMKGDREKCLEAGMSDYIAKPVNIEQLLSLMRVWLYR
jgi:CheY-like chemotaxis protein/HAMP domain-containing protein